MKGDLVPRPLPMKAQLHLAYEDNAKLRSRIAALEAQLAARTGGDRLLDVLRQESWDLRCFSIPTGQGDADIGWRVVGHFMAKPHERTIAEVYHDDPRAALKAAMEDVT